jgi:hypothetical protein
MKDRNDEPQNSANSSTKSTAYFVGPLRRSPASSISVGAHSQHPNSSSGLDVLQALVRLLQMDSAHRRGTWHSIRETELAGSYAQLIHAQTFFLFIRLRPVGGQLPGVSLSSQSAQSSAGTRGEYQGTVGFKSSLAPT